jgi:hypothetical protein
VEHGRALTLFDSADANVVVTDPGLDEHQVPEKRFRYCEMVIAIVHSGNRMTPP